MHYTVGFISINLHCPSVYYSLNVNIVIGGIIIHNLVGKLSSS